MQVTNIYDVAKELIGYFNPGSGVSIKIQLKKEQKKYKIKIMGVGNDGSLFMKQSILKFNIVTAGYTKFLSLIVINSSKTILYIDSHIEQILIEDNTSEE